MSLWGDIKHISMPHFLNFYEKHQNLWNPRLYDYKNRSSRNKSYDEMIEELNFPNLTHNDIRLKIKSIRTIYKKELKILLLKKARGENYKPKLAWFDQADVFLRQVSSSRKPRNVVEGAKTQPEIKPTNEPTDDEIFQLDDCEQIEELSVEECDQPQNYIYEDYEMEKFQNLNRKSQCKTQSVENVEMLNDEYQQFCNSVAAQLRAIPDLYSRAMAKFKIQQILFEAETGQYKKN